MKKKIKTQPEFYVLPTLTILLLLGGMFFYHNVESWSYVDALYFSVVSLTTVGYGDLAPTSQMSKIFTIVYIFIGIGIILSFINAILKSKIEKKFVKIRKKLKFKK